MIKIAGGIFIKESEGSARLGRMLDAVQGNVTKIDPAVIEAQLRRVLSKSLARQELQGRTKLTQAGRTGVVSAPVAVPAVNPGNAPDLFKGAGLQSALLNAYPKVGINRATQLAAQARTRMLRRNVAKTRLATPLPTIPQYPPVPGVVGQQLTVPKTLPGSGDFQ